MKNKVSPLILILILCLLIVFSFFLKMTDDQTKPDYGHLLENLENPKPIEEHQYYKIYCDDNSNYLYMIFDKDGNIVKSEQYSREPHITIFDNKTISISLQAGTGIATRWTYYYDISEGKFSNVFYAVFQENGDRVIYGQSNAIIVRDIFDETKFLRTFDVFEGIAQNTAFPFVDAEFVDEGRKIGVTYFNDKYEEITVMFDLN